MPVRRLVVLAAITLSCGHAPMPPTRAPAAVAAPRAIVPRATIDGDFLERWAATYHFTLGTPGACAFTPTGDALYFTRSGPRTFVRDLYALDVASGHERVVLTADQLLRGADEQLSPDERARRERTRQVGRGITSFALAPDAIHLLVPLSGRLFLVDRATGNARELGQGAHEPAVDPRFSPDGRRVAVVRGRELSVIDVASGAEHAVTQPAGANVTHGVAEFVAQEEMDREEGYWWSPDSSSLVFEEADATGVERLYVADPMHPEREPEANVFPRAGHANVRVRLGRVELASGRTTWITWDSTRYPYLASVHWSANAPLTLVVQTREQDRTAVLAAEASGATRELLAETDAAWVELDASVPRWLPDGSGFLWSTERDGHAALELRAPDGHALRTLTDASLGYRRLLHVDAAAGMAYVQGGSEPAETQLYRVPLDPAHGASAQISQGAGEHDALFAAHAPLRMHVATRPDADTTWTVERDDGAPVASLRSVAEAAGLVPRVERVTVGARALRAVLVRPRDFDPAARYPVIVSVYGGPGYRTVTAARDRYLLAQWIADHGYVVVSVDGRGTPYRDRAWERAIREHIGDVPLEDQVDGLRALGARFRELDLARVGIFGWSFGGYLSAFAALRRPDVFHAAVAGAPVSDWHDYDTHYTERYLGLPDAHRDAYDRASLLTWAPTLARPLLVIHGTADDNVYFTHGARLTDALFRAGRPHEFLPLVGFTHVVPDPLIARRLYDTVLDFFARSLAGGGHDSRRRLD